MGGGRGRGRNGVRKRKPRPDRASIGGEKSLSFQNSERSRALFMEAADSDKDSKSSELTIGPSCIQFRLIIVKVEKFQSAVSGHPRDIPTALPFIPCCRPPSRLDSPSEKEREKESSLFSFFTARTTLLLLLLLLLSRVPRSRIRFYEFRTVARSFREFTISVCTVYTIKVSFPVPLRRSAGGRRRRRRCVL